MGVVHIIMKAKKALNKAERFVQKNIGMIDKYVSLLEEGYYQTEQTSFLGKMLGKKKAKNDPFAPPVMLGSKAVDGAVSGIVAGMGKYAWLALGAYLTFNGYIFAAAGLLVSGVAFVANEVRKAKIARDEIITEENFAGQIVQGARKDLYHLHVAQAKILELPRHFKRASIQSVSQTLKLIVDDVEHLRDRVKIVDVGPHGASASVYSFSKESYKLVDDFSLNPVPHKNSTLTGLDLKKSWDEMTAANRELLINTLAALQQVLPDEVQEEVTARASRLTRKGFNAPKPGQGTASGTVH